MLVFCINETQKRTGSKHYSALFVIVGEGDVLDLPGVGLAYNVVLDKLLVVGPDTEEQARGVPREGIVVNGNARMGDFKLRVPREVYKIKFDVKA